MNGKIKKMTICLITVLSIVAGVFSFKPVKADTLTPITTTSYGSYFAETYYYESQNTYIDNIVIDAGLVQFNINNINSSAFHLHYDFDELYNGTISITVTNAINWKLNDCSVAVEGGWFETVPSVSSTVKSKTFVIGVYQSSEIDLVIGHEGRSVSTAAFALTSTYSITENIHTTYDEIYYLNNIDDRLLGILSYCDDISNIYDYITSDMEDTLSAISSNLALIYTNVAGIDNYLAFLREYRVPTEMIPAYVLFSDYSLYQNNSELYPYIVVLSSQSKMFRIESGETLYFYYMAPTSGWSNSITNTDFQLSSERLSQYQISGMSIYKISITNPLSSSATTKYVITYQTGGNKVTPLYFGNGVGMSDSLRSLLGIEDPVVSLLHDILENGTIPSGLQNTFNTVMTSISDFYSHILDFLPSVNVFNAQFSDITENESTVNLNTVLQFTNTFYNNLVFNIPFIKTIIVLSLTVIVMKVFLL